MQPLEPLSPAGVQPCLRQCLEDETLLEGYLIRAVSLAGMDLSRLEVRRCRFEDCDLSGTLFESASFEHTQFYNCDLSNCLCADSYWNETSLTGCKCIGAVFAGAVWKHISLNGCLLRYAAVDRARLDRVSWSGVDFTEGSMSGTRLKGFSVDRCRLLKNNLFQTALIGVDFTTCEFSGPTLSAPPEELRGAKITAAQAADLIRLWGLVVE